MRMSYTGKSVYSEMSQVFDEIRLSMMYLDIGWFCFLPSVLYEVLQWLLNNNLDRLPLHKTILKAESLEKYPNH